MFGLPFALSFESNLLIFSIYNLPCSISISIVRFVYTASVPVPMNAAEISFLHARQNIHIYIALAPWVPRKMLRNSRSAVKTPTKQYSSIFRCTFPSFFMGSLNNARPISLFESSKKHSASKQLVWVLCSNLTDDTLSTSIFTILFSNFIGPVGAGSGPGDGSGTYSSDSDKFLGSAFG